MEGKGKKNPASGGSWIRIKEDKFIG